MARYFSHSALKKKMKKQAYVSPCNLQGEDINDKIRQKFGSTATVATKKNKTIVSVGGHNYHIDDDLRVLNKKGTLVEMTPKHILHTNFDSLKETPRLLKGRSNEAFARKTIMGDSFRYVEYQPHVVGHTFMRICVFHDNKLLGVSSQEISEHYSDVLIEVSQNVELKFPFPRGSAGMTRVVAVNEVYIVFTYIY